METLVNSRKFPREVINLGLLSFISILLSLQVLIIVAWISSHIPLETEMGSLFEIYREQLRPERDAFFYHLFVAGCVFIQAVLTVVFRKHLNDNNFTESLKRFLFVEAFLVFLLCFLLFKMILYYRWPLAVHLFYGTLAVAVLSKIFWGKIDAFYLRLGVWGDGFKGSVIFTRLVDIIMGLGIFVALFIPNVPGIIAKIYTGDGFHHFDTFIMSPGWAAFKGCALNVDTYSQYGIGVPYIISTLSALSGGFTYENVFYVLEVMAIFYFILVYIFLRLWLRDVCVAAAGVLLAIKCAMFSHGADYFIWQFPMGTVVRHFFDVFFFIFLLMHLRSPKKIFIFSAAMINGLALFYINDTGMYLLGAFYAYCLLLLLIPQGRLIIYNSRKDTICIVLYFIVPVIVYLMMLLCVIGSHVFNVTFWRNSTEMIRFVTQGLTAVPVLDNLKNKEFFYFFAAWVVALGCIFSVLFVGSLYLLRKIKPASIPAVILSIYGLGLFHYYIFRSTATNFFGVSIPFVLVMCFWFHKMLGQLSLPAQNRARIVIVAMALFFLLSTHSFIKYPNVFNLTQESFAQYKEEMATSFISEQDVDLIKRLTQPQEKVPLVSSFETATLMAADRKPFFYYFHLVNSRSMRMREFGGWKLLTQEQYDKTIRQMTQEAPEYIFIERRLISGGLPAIYYYHFKTLKTFIDYLKDYYYPLETGKYLVALKHK